jgi:hypothetical protein
VSGGIERLRGCGQQPAGPNGGAIVGMIVDHQPHLMSMKLRLGARKGVPDVPRCHRPNHHHIDFPVGDADKQCQQAGQVAPSLSSADGAINVDAGNRPSTVGDRIVRQLPTPTPLSSSTCSSFALNVSLPYH